METIEKFLNKKGEPIWVKRTLTSKSDYNLTYSKKVAENINQETQEPYASTKTKWINLSVSDYNYIFKNFELLDTNRNLPPFPTDYKLKDKTYFLRYIQSSQISKKTEDYKYIDKLLLMFKKQLSVSDLIKIELIEEKLYNKLLESFENIDLATKYHLKNNYAGKNANISLDGINGALNKALDKQYGFKLNKDELGNVHRQIKEQSRSKGLSK